MIVYVETNFLLELAFLQEEHESCDDVLSWADAGVITLVVPAFSITEARMGLVRLAKQRNEFYERLRRELREISRSKPYATISAQTEPLTNALIESTEEQWIQLESATSRLLGLAQIIPLQSTTIQLAIEHEANLGLEPPDAAVYASIIEDVRGRQGPKCFLNRNSKDFDIPDIESELSHYDCKMIPSFKDGSAYIRSALPIE
jgi:hypothetical protein